MSPVTTAIISAIVLRQIFQQLPIRGSRLLRLGNAQLQKRDTYTFRGYRYSLADQIRVDQIMRYRYQDVCQTGRVPTGVRMYRLTSARSPSQAVCSLPFMHSFRALSSSTPWSP